jgi:hypothetical protein
VAASIQAVLSAAITATSVSVRRTTLRTRDRAAISLLVTITTSRHSGIASSSATAAPPTCPVSPRMIAAKFSFIKRTSVYGRMRQPRSSQECRPFGHNRSGTLLRKWRAWGEYWMSVYAISTIASTGTLPQFPGFLQRRPERFRPTISAANVAQAPPPAGPLWWRSMLLLSQVWTHAMPCAMISRSYDEPFHGAYRENSRVFSALGSGGRNLFWARGNRFQRGLSTCQESSSVPAIEGDSG